MSEQPQSTPDHTVPVQPSPHPAPDLVTTAPLLPYAAYAPVAQAAPGFGSIGQVRSTGSCILLTIVTLGIYPLVWYYQTHEEMKRHTGEGLGGALALVIGFFAGIILSFVSPAEVGRLYERRGLVPPVTALTGLWATLGALILVGPLVWFVKTNSALNAYWRSLGAQG